MARSGGQRWCPTSSANCPDAASGLPRSRAAIEDAAKRNVFARGFKRDLRVAGDLAARTDQLIERAAIDALAIAGKAGAVICGFTRIEAAVGRDDIRALTSRR